jgi:hypothetical protein
MRWPRHALVLPLLYLATPAATHGQEWRLSTQFGHLTWEGAAPATTEQSSVALGLSRSTYHEWIGAAAGAPLAGGSFWATAGAAKRVAMDARAGLGLDVASHAFLQRIRETAATAPPVGLPVTTRTGSETIAGGGGQTMAVVFARLDDVRLELRGGIAGQATYASDATQQDHAPVADGRLLVQLGRLQAGSEAQHWHRRATYAGGVVTAGAGRLVAWGSAGRWTHGGPEGMSWAAGGELGLPGGVRIEASYRHNGFDPLYHQPTAVAAVLGASVRLGSGSRYAPPIPAAYAGGAAVIRLRARDARGEPRIAGDFTEWKPVPMAPAGDAWTLTVPLEPGVYHYAFVTEDGEWFVPERTPGRRSDGMGGWVAVLIVSE